MPDRLDRATVAVVLLAVAASVAAILAVAQACGAWQ